MKICPYPRSISFIISLPHATLSVIFIAFIIQVIPSRETSFQTISTIRLAFVNILQSYEKQITYAFQVKKRKLSSHENKKTGADQSQPLLKISPIYCCDTY